MIIRIVVMKTAIDFFTNIIPLIINKLQCSRFED